MSKIIKFNKNGDLVKTNVLIRIEEESAQENLDETIRKNLRIAKWDNLLYNSVPIITILFFLVVFGIIELPPNLNSAFGAGGLTTIITAIFRAVYKQNSS